MNETKKLHGKHGSKENFAWNRYFGIKKISFEKFLDIFKGIEQPGMLMTDLGVMPQEIAKTINRNGCAPYPALFCLAFIKGRDGSSEAARKTGFSVATAHRYAKKHPETYAAGLQARAEREAASKPAPPELPVNTSVDF